MRKKVRNVIADKSCRTLKVIARPFTFILSEAGSHEEVEAEAGHNSFYDIKQ